jgi:hypothetical protein
MRGKGVGDLKLGPLSSARGASPFLALDLVRVRLFLRLVAVHLALVPLILALLRGIVGDAAGGDVGVFDDIRVHVKREPVEIV